MKEDNQDKKSQLADASSIIRVLNKLGTNVKLCGGTIFFKSRNKKFTKDLEVLANTYRPLIEMELHDCGEKDCSIHHYYVLDVKVKPEIHSEAAHALYTLLEKYTKKLP